MHRIIYLLGALWVGAVMTSCGYTLQNSKSSLLENEGIRTLYIEPLINNTYKPGVENLVYNQLVKTIAAHKRVRIVQSPEDADAILKGAITDASVEGGPIVVQVSTLKSNLLLPRNFEQDQFEPDKFAVRADYRAGLSCAFELSKSKSFKMRSENRGKNGSKKSTLSGSFFTPVLQGQKHEDSQFQKKETDPTSFGMSLEAGALPVPKSALSDIIWSGSFSNNKLFPGSQAAFFSSTSNLINESEFDRALGDLAESQMQDLHESMLGMF